MINVVAAYLAVNGKFLICKRAYGDLKGYWEFPGGKIEKGEDLFDAIKREISEELELDIIPEKIVQKFSHTYPANTVNLTLVKCKLKDTKQQIHSDGSHTDFAWITVNATEKLFAPLDKKILDYLIKN